MSERPSFQFYPGDWLRNAKLRRCSMAARGAWIDVLCLLHDSEEYGVLRWPLADIAHASGIALALLEELASKGVIKGSDEGSVQFVYRPRHAGKEGNPITLVDGNGGPCWFCSRFVRDEHVRKTRGKSTQFTAGNQPTRTPNNAPTRPVGEREGDGSSFAFASAFAVKSNNPPNPPDGGNPSGVEKPEKPKRKARAKSEALLLPDWMADCKAKGEPFIKPDDPIRQWADDASIPDDYMRLAWLVFVDRYRTAKPQKDWPAHFRNAIRGNWLKLWYIDADGDCRLTTAGLQEQKVHGHG